MRPLDFERPLYDILEKIKELEIHPSLRHKVEELRRQAEELRRDIYDNLSRWQVVQIARHPDRLKAKDYIEAIFEDFVELHGDRLYADDHAIISGVGRIGGMSVVLIAQEKGSTTTEKIRRNFGMPHPEGYRKAMRMMDVAQKYRMPIITLVDTPGAYPGIGAEERGQFSAIAYSIRKMLSVRTPTLSYIIGEGGSGGALAIAVADRVFALQYSIYSVISPEGAASILFRDASRAPEAAEALRITARDLMELGIVDDIVEEPVGGNHWNPSAMLETLREHIIGQITELVSIPMDELLEKRYEKYRRMGLVST